MIKRYHSRAVRIDNKAETSGWILLLAIPRLVDTVRQWQKMLANIGFLLRRSAVLLQLRSQLTKRLTFSKIESRVGKSPSPTNAIGAYCFHRETAVQESLIRGFGVLYLLLSYFEMIARYEAGNTAKSKPGQWFRKGLKFVYPRLASGTPGAVQILDKIYKGARCGLYHAGLTRENVYISGDVKGIQFDSTVRSLTINPGDVIDDIATNFKAYSQKLREPGNTKLRADFETKFNAEILPQIC